MNELNKINIDLLYLMLQKGVSKMVEKYRYIDELNIFPVPDGDTGTNMKVTFESGFDAIKEQNFEDIFLLGKTFARALLMNARGNSGVISSQIFKGFFKYIPEQTKEIDIPLLIQCFVGAKELSYKAVITPVEGTILTVVRMVAEALVVDEKKFTTIPQIFEYISNIAEKALAKTPKLLPALKEAGVVDSGGYGFCRIIEGMKDAIEMYTGTKETTESNESNKKEISQNSKEKEFLDNNDGFGYCNEFIMTIGSKVEGSQKDKIKFNAEKFKKQLEKMGESIVFVRDENIVKVHIHTPYPWNVFAYASKFGEFNKVKVENMTLQYLEKNPNLTLEELFDKKHTKQEEQVFKNSSNIVKIITTVPDNITAELFEEKFGIKNIIKTNLVGNPSVDNFIKQIKNTNSLKNIILLNDSNYALPAQHMTNLLPKNINAEIIITRNIATSYYLGLIFNEKVSYEKNIKNMYAALKKTQGILISQAAKEGIFNKVKVSKNDFFSIVNKKIIKSSKNLFDVASVTTKKTLGRGKIKDCYIFVGADTSKEDINKFSDYLKNTYKINANIFFTQIQNYPISLVFVY